MIAGNLPNLLHFQTGGLYGAASFVHRREKVSVEVMLNRAKYFDRTGKVNDHTIYLSGNLGKNALEFAMCLSAKATGGRVYTMGHTLVIEEAEKITEKLERAMAQSREHKIILLPRCRRRGIMEK